MNRSKDPSIRKVFLGTIEVGLPGKPLLLAGPCVIESEEMTLEIAAMMKEMAVKWGFNYAFKSSFDKANRTSMNSYRGPGLEKGLAILAKVKARFDLPVLTDIHLPSQAAPAAEVADILQIPAFLCRQTDLVVAAALTGRALNIKKGQFLSPDEMGNVVEKVRSTGNERIIITERGTFFGYGRLVVDMAGMIVMRSFGYPVIFDATHSVQNPGGLGDRSGGNSSMAPVLARAAAAAGCDGLFIEVHPQPEKALSDSSTSLDYTMAETLLSQASAVFAAMEGKQLGN